MKTWNVVREQSNLSSNGRTRARCKIVDEDSKLTVAEVRAGPAMEEHAALLGNAPALLAACELAAAFVGMHTGGGVPNRYMGRFDHLLNDPKATLTFILNCITKAEGK